MIRFFIWLAIALSLPALARAADPDLDSFKRAWRAAGQGDRADFEQIKAGLSHYVLYPYLQYEDFRFRRASADAAEVAAFLDAYSDWAFAPGLRTAWLRALGKKRRWDDLLSYAPGERDTEVQCYLAQARIERNDTAQLLPQAQALWAVGQSQPDACDPVFAWLIREKGITPELAWLRIKRAVEARNPRLTLYLARFVPARERVWVERWQEMEVQGYVRLDRARRWPDQDKARDITQFGLMHLARRDADRAWKLFTLLDGKIDWGADRRGVIQREIALWSAVAQVSGAVERLRAVPKTARDDNLLEWWARYALATENWTEAIGAITAMSEPLRTSDRWQYWDARARIASGQPEKDTALRTLAGETSYYGFLAADYLDGEYSICPERPVISAPDLSRFKKRPAVRRIIELDAAGLRNWMREEWNLAMKRWSQEDLRLAAALAVERGWPDLGILALAKSGDRNWYDWRFPIAFLPETTEKASNRGLDVAWVMGLIRSESAMAADAVSAAGARGLMQLTPGTAAQVARRNGYTYRGSKQLMQVEDNVLFGTAYLRELMDRFDNNPVLVLGAYNAGPGAVERWLDTLPARDPAIWIESLPYFETRDYIPRVLAFTTIYDWRMQQPVRRVSSRMPGLDSVTMGAGNGKPALVEVSCPDSAAVSQSGR